MNYRKLLQLPQNCTRRLINHHLSWLGLAASLPLFGMVTAFAVAPGDPQPAAAEVRQRMVTEKLALPVFTPPSNGTRYWRNETVNRGDTIAHVLNRLGVRDSEARRFLYSSPLSRDLLKLNTGATLAVETSDEGELYALRFLNDDENGEKVLVAIAKQGDQWQASADPLTTESMDSLRSITVRRSAARELQAAGVPREVMVQLADIFADQFSLDSLQPGDSIQLVFESLIYNGSPIANGNILAAEISRGGQWHRAFYFAHDSESGAYYDAAGRPVKKGFSQQPVAHYRISSGFGTRYHPVLHSLRMHQGVDYAAAPGTPIVAPADGVISAAETQNGYGKVITLRHNAKLSTLYAHMQRFAPGVKAGKPVKAGDLLGYVGSTGRVTGPHLHFEVKLNGQAVDPATAALPAPGLAAGQRQAFAKLSSQLTDKLALLRDTPGTIAQLD